MGNLPKISVIIPVYNAEKYLAQCLTSVLSQSFQNFEVICINDGSSDTSGTILEDFSRVDNRFIVINQANHGQSFSRNRALEIARGEYVFFLDADDYIAPNAFQKLLHVSEKNNVDVIFFNGKLFFPSGDSFPFWEPWIVKSFPSGCYDVFDNDRVGFFTNVCTTFYKLSFLQTNGLKFIANLLYEDLEFNYKVLSFVERYYWLNESLYFYRRSVEGSTTSRIDNTSLDIFRAFRHSRDILVEKGRYQFFEYVISLNVIRHAYGKFERDIALSANDDLKNLFFQELKSFLLRLEPHYIESIVAPLNKVMATKVLSIRDNELSSLSFAPPKKSYVRKKLIKFFDWLGIKADLHYIVKCLRNIAKNLKKILKTFSKMKTTIRKRLT